MDRRLSRRSLLKRAGLAAGGVMLVACSKPTPTPQPKATTVAQPTKPPATPAPAKKVAVTFTMYGHPGMIEQMVPLFNESHPTVEVKFERSEGQGYWQKLSAAVAAGSAWDCFRGDVNRALGWGPKGNVIVDVKPFLDADQTYPASGYLPGILDVYAVAGRIFGLPTWCLTMWLFYNKKMFDAAGIPYPTTKTTWEEHVEMARKLTKRDASDKITQYGLNGWNGWTFPVMQAVWSEGGCFYYNNDLTATCVDDPKTVKVMQDIADLTHVHKVTPNPLSPPSGPTGILSDNVAMEANGDYLPWDNKDVFQAKYDYLDATLCPTRNGNRVNVYWPDCFIINAKASPEVQAAAYKWVSWFACDPASTAIQCKVVFPVYKKAYEDPEIAKKWLVPPRPKGMIAAALEHSKSLKYWKVDLHIGDLDGVYYGEVGNLWNNKARADVVMKTMQEKMAKIMATPVEVKIG